MRDKGKRYARPTLFDVHEDLISRKQKALDRFKRISERPRVEYGEWNRAWLELVACEAALACAEGRPPEYVGDA
jgi:hypothetical protein